MDKRRNNCDETWFRLREWVQGQKSSERLAACLIANEGYKSIDPSHPLGGKDGLKDAICRKNGKLYVAAAYFPRGQQPYKEIAQKFTDDIRGTHKIGASGFIFVTNQELSLSERKKLQSGWAGCLIDIYHLERLTSLLNIPQNYGVRLEFLDIALEKEEQLSYFAFKETAILKIAESFDRFSQDYKEFKEHILERTYGSEIRKEEEIKDAIDEHFDKVWYDRHQLLVTMVRAGKQKVDPDTWKRALEAAKRLERLYGKGKLGPYDDFDWGMINGKLSALRWVMGDEWDMLDT